MSGKNTSTRILNYVSSDLENGLTYIKLALGNIINSFINGTNAEYIVNCNINGFLLSELLEYYFSNITIDVCNKEYLVFKLENICISVNCNYEKLKFKICK